ncbi:MAG: DNA polymerase III subunit delta [Flavobacterium sp.]|nr:DNA polymerase III subunit delta [Flavobacterium sp.]
MDEVLKIINDIKAGNIKPIYFLMGEEPYYIDKLCEYIEKNILQEHERDFNQTTLYGRDVTIDDIVATAKRFPMMADKQVVIVKEAQDLSRTIDNLETYALNPQPTTVLVICYKYKVLNRTKKATKAIIKAGVLFESKKMFENQLGTWITRVLQSKKLSIEPKASAMLIEFLGNDLSKIANEISKLEIILPPNSIITPLHIEQNIGFSKDFNNFEFIAAIGSKNQLRAYKIAQYFGQNSKDNPIVVTTSLVFGFFNKLLLYHGTKDKNPAKVAALLRISPYFIKDYDLGIKNYPMKKVSSIIAQLRQTDIKSKGVGASALPHSDLLNELLYSIFN